MSDLPKFPQSTEALRYWEYSRETLMECAPLGKIYRLIAYHVAEKYLPDVYVAGACLCSVPGIMILVWLMMNLSNPAARTFLTGTSNILAVFLLFALIPLMRVLLRPTHLGVSKSGLRMHYRRTFWRWAGKRMLWADVREIKLVQPADTTLIEHHLLSFETRQRKIQIKIGEFVNSEQLPLLWEAITVLAVNAKRDFNLQTLLGESTNSTYTDLWLKALTASPDRNRLTPLPKGALLKDSEYEVDRQIGMGGQGVAYLAKRRGRQQEPLVLKEYVLPIQASMSARAESIERLQKEAQMLEKLAHPNIVKLVDSFFEDHRGYLVMEYVTGSNLAALVRSQGPLPEQQALQYMKQMCEILAFLHSRQQPIVHRDFTPDNLILTEAGLIKLIDFNVAQERKTQDTVTSTVVGKHAYMSPEQFRGKPVPASDLYSLGATMHFLLTGREPRPISVSHPREVNEAVSTRLDGLIARLTAVNAADRPSEAKAVLEELK